MNCKKSWITLNKDTCQMKIAKLHHLTKQIKSINQIPCAKGKPNSRHLNQKTPLMVPSVPVHSNQLAGRKKYPRTIS